MRNSCNVFSVAIVEELQLGKKKKSAGECLICGLDSGMWVEKTDIIV